MGLGRLPRYNDRAAMEATTTNMTTTATTAVLMPALDVSKGNPSYMAHPQY
ncbi:MAG TPA: hypothetical protein VIW22_03210 [Nitrososphaerales archaeon]